MADLVYNTRDGDTVDLIAWRHYGRTDNGVVETLLQANHGLADYGAALPAGLRVSLPAIETPATVDGIQLWD